MQGRANMQRCEHARAPGSRTLDIAAQALSNLRASKGAGMQGRTRYPYMLARASNIAHARVPGTGTPYIP